MKHLHYYCSKFMTKNIHPELQVPPKSMMCFALERTSRTSPQEVKRPMSATDSIHCPQCSSAPRRKYPRIKPRSHAEEHLIPREDAHARHTLPDACVSAATQNMQFCKRECRIPRRRHIHRWQHQQARLNPRMQHALSLVPAALSARQTY